MKMEISAEKPSEQALSEAFTQKVFQHSISEGTAYEAVKLAEDIGFTPLLALINKLATENATRASHGQGQLSIPAAFRQGLRQLKTRGNEAAVQKKKDDDQREHREEVKKLAESGFNPDTETLWRMLDGETDEMAQARRFLISLQQTQSVATDPA